MVRKCQNLSIYSLIVRTSFLKKSLDVSRKLLTSSWRYSLIFLSVFLDSNWCDVVVLLFYYFSKEMTTKLQQSVILSYPIPQVVQRIKAVDNETRLLVVDPETHESLRSLRLTATEEMAVISTGLPSSSSPQPSPSPTPPSIPSSPSKKRENGSVSKQPVTLSSQVQKPTRRSPSKAAKKVNWPSTKAGHVALRIIKFVFYFPPSCALLYTSNSLTFGSL